MKKSKLINVLLPTTLALTTTGIVMPLASCAKETPVVKDKVSLGSDANQTLDDNNEASFTLKLDNDYDNVQVAFDGEHSDWFKITKIAHLKDTVTIKVQFLSTVNEDTTFPFRFSVTTSAWTASSPDVSVNVIAKAEQETVDAIDTILTESTTKPTLMSDLISLLATKGINLESLPTNDTTSQWVWDCKENKIFVLKQDGTVKCAPKGYTLNQYKVNIWKMVGGNKTSNLRSSLKEESVNKDTFSSTCEYSQYLRTKEEFTTQLEFCSGLDTGSHEKLELTFKKEGTLTQDQPAAIINTSKSSLTVDSDLNNIEHHGNLSSLIINSLPEEGTYTEFGSVDATIVINDGSLVAEAGSEINSVKINSADVDTIEIKTGGEISSVYIDKTVSEQTGKTADKYIEKDPGVEQPEIPAPITPSEIRYAAGTGSARSPYAISTAQQLLYCQADVNAGIAEIHFVLSNDIDMDNIDTFTGIGTTDHPFAGTFDGKEYSIKNLTIQYETSEERVGLFRMTTGETDKIKFKAKTDIWDTTTNKLKSENIEESCYSTVIKNINLENINYTNPDQKYIGGLVADAINTYIANVNVKSGTISGWKLVGGVAGALEGSVAYNCNTGKDLVIKTNGYNTGGICGTTNYGGTTIPGEAIVNCNNYASIISESNESGGYIGGIGGMLQNGSVGVAVDSCNNYGNITITANDPNKAASSASGIAAQANNVYVIANCTNEGNINITNSNASHVSGISAYGEPIIYNCSNKGNITASADHMAGIFAIDVSTITGEGPKLISCTNSGTLTNNNPDGSTCDLADGMTMMTLKDRTFANVHELNTAISSAVNTAITLELINVTVTKTSDEPLNIPVKMSTITSNTKICDSILITSTNISNRLNLSLPDCSINISDDCPNCYLEQKGNNSTITIAQGKKIGTVIVTGTESQVINNGTVTDLIGIDGAATYGENNGTCSRVSLGSNASLGTVDKHFVNNGTVKDTSSESNRHEFNTCGGSVGNIVIDNYGTIEFEGASTSGYYGYLFCIYHTGSTDINCYENSKVITNCNQSYVFAVSAQHTYNVNYKDSATFNNQSWSTKNFGQYVSLTRI